MLEGQATPVYFLKDTQTSYTLRDRSPPPYCLKRNNSFEINILCDKSLINISVRS